jgi:hypothetical protein
MYEIIIPERRAHSKRKVDEQITVALRPPNESRVTAAL